MKLRYVAPGLVGLAFTAASCVEAETLPPLGHHVVTIDTDAIVPPDPREPVPVSAAIPLFDRLELAILREGEEAPTPEAVRDFPVDESSFANRGATFTVDASAGEVVRVRARLFRSTTTFDGIPRPESTIEVTAELPRTPKEGAVYTTVTLLTEDTGVKRGTPDEPLSPESNDSSRVRPGEVEASLVGTWPGATQRACDGEGASGEACVHGGAYWMGNPLVTGDDFSESDRQRLVVLSPFFLDTREVRVGELREWLSTRPELDTVVRKSDDITSDAFFCTYTDSPLENELMPANCVRWDTALAYCESRGATLPTEAQFEFASSELRSALFVWGTDKPPLCEAAVWGRGGRPNTVIAGVGSDECLSLGDGPQSLPDDPIERNLTRLTDRISLGATEVFDLAGNLQEWVRDRYNKQDESCWQRSESNVFVDPVCSSPGEISARSVRGGSWIQDREFLRAAYRANRTPDVADYVIGFRCARPAG